MDEKTRGVVAYLTIIGWVVAIATNNPKSEFASFHIRQMLGIMCLGFVAGITSIFPLIGLVTAMLGYFAAFILWIIALIAAINGETKSVPLLGEQFQEWFKAL